MLLLSPYSSSSGFGALIRSDIFAELRLRCRTRSINVIACTRLRSGRICVHARLVRLRVELELAEPLERVDAQDLRARLARRDVLPNDARTLREAWCQHHIGSSSRSSRTHLALEAESASFDAVLAAQPLIDSVTGVAGRSLRVVNKDDTVYR